MNFKTGEPTNNKKLLELGKEVTQEVIERFEDSFYGYVQLKDIKDETLISIGKQLYSDTEAFIDYLRSSYGENDFVWDESMVNSYDLIHEIVSKEIVKSGEYYFDENSELYLLVTSLFEVNTEKKLMYRLSSIRKLEPLTIMLNEKDGEFLFIMLSDDEEDYILQNSIYKKTHLVQNINYGQRYSLSDINKIDNLTMDLLEIVNFYTNHPNNWTDLETAKHFWNYIKDSYEFDNIAEDLDQKEFNKKLLDSIVEIMNREDFFEEDMKFILVKIKEELYSYHNGDIDSMESYYTELKEIVWKAVHESFSEHFVSNEDYVWIPLDNQEKFKLSIEKRLNELENINSFNLMNVLPKEVEYDILLRFIRNDIKEYMEDEYEQSITLVKLDYFWEEAEKNIGLFFGMGNMKNLTEKELESMYANILVCKDEDSVKDFSIRYLREYLMNILNPKNDIDNKFDLIALYHIILENLDKINPYIDTIIENGFTVEDFEDKIKNIKLSDMSIKSNVAKEFKSIFKSYISKKENLEAPSCCAQMPDFCESKSLNILGF